MGGRLSVPVLALVGRYLSLRMRLHGLACGRHMYGIDHTHHWVPDLHIGGQTYSCSITYAYGRGRRKHD